MSGFGRSILVTLAVTLAGTGSATAAAQGGDAAEPRPVDDPAVTSGLAWHLDEIGAPTAWRSSLGAGITVAIVDSGVDVDHPDLAGQVLDSVSCVGAAGDPDACVPALGSAGADAHGTHVAGIVAARADDGTGVAGVAPRAHLLAVRTLTPECRGPGCLPVGDTADVAAGVRWSVRNGADVINLSLTASRRLGPELTAALEEAWDAGVVPVLAAGNGSTAAPTLDPPKALVVTATVRSGERAAYGPEVDGPVLGVAAPGGAEGDSTATCRIGAVPGGIISTTARDSGDGSGYACLAGTSMAVPQVSAGLALLLSMGYDRDGAVDRLLGTARPGPGLGAGLIDLAAATAAPRPSGVRAEEQRFETATPSPEVRTASTGPFAPSTRSRRSVPLWLWLLLGGLVAGLAADVALRLAARHRRLVAQLGAEVETAQDGGAPETDPVDPPPDGGVPTDRRYRDRFPPAPPGAPS